MRQRHKQLSAEPRQSPAKSHRFAKGAADAAARALLAVLAICAVAPVSLGAQGPVTPANPAPPAPAAPGPAAVGVPVSAGGKLHGVILSGKIPLPGVAVTATNTLTGKRFTTTTDITGAWSMTIPQNGRYVIRTDFAAFAPVTHEALLNAANHDQLVNFELSLASRVAAQEATQAAQGQSQQVAQAIRQLGGNGAQTLSLINSLGAGTDAAEGGAAASGAALPGAAQNSTFSSDSVAVNGQSGTVSPLAGIDVDRIRDAMETMRAQGQVPGGGGFFGGQGFGGGPGGGGGGFGGGGFGGAGGFGGGRGAFRGFRPDQPHGAIFWTGSNSALNAQLYSLRGQDTDQPPYGSNQFGLTFIGEPFIPKLTKPSGKDTLFITLAGTRTSTPYEQYAVVPVASQRVNPDGSACSATLTSGQSPACNLFTFFPQPNLANNTNGYNYYFATTAQTNSTQGGLRYIRSIGPNAGTPTGRGGGGGGGGGGGRGGRNNRTQNQPLRQSINANFNYSSSAGDEVKLFPELGGKTSAHSYSLQAGYSLGYHRFNNNLTGGWNRTNSETTNFFTNKTDIASQIGICGPGSAITSPCQTPLNTSPLNYGIPNITLSGSTGLSEVQPAFSLQQTISLSDTLSYGHGKHNYRFGADYHRVHYDLLGSANATGTFEFFGDTADQAIASLSADQPLGSTIQSSITKSYLRQNTWDLYANDDFRAFSILTLNYGIRYEYFSPYAEKYDHMAELAANSGFTQLDQVTPNCVSGDCSTVPRTLVYPFRGGVAPRLGLALRLPRSTVLRAGYGINFTNGQYLAFARTLIRQPPYANLQTNDATAIPITLQNGFPQPESGQAPNYALQPHYTLPYVQAWNIDIQKTLPLGLLLNVAYNGSKGNHLDVTSAPQPCPIYATTACGQIYNNSPVPDTTGIPFKYEQSSAFSKFSQGTVRLNKRLSKGVSITAYYQYSHSIDDAGSVGGTSTVVAQNWQDLDAEEGNSSFDVRHKVTGTYLFELPFGKDKQFLSGGGTASRILEGLSISGAYTFATGTPLTPVFQASAANILNNTAGTERPNRIPGASITAGGGSVTQWFNTAAFSPTAPANGIGNAARNSIPGPGILTNNMSLSKTAQLGDTRSLEIRATAGNVFNTVQYAGVDTNVTSPTFGQVTSAATMRNFQFLARFRF